MSKLRDRLEEFKTTFESGDPPYNATPEVVATMHRATAEAPNKAPYNLPLRETECDHESRGQCSRLVLC